MTMVTDRVKAHGNQGLSKDSYNCIVNLHVKNAISDRENVN